MKPKAVFLPWHVPYNQTVNGDGIAYHYDIKTCMTSRPRVCSQAPISMLPRCNQNCVFGFAPSGQLWLNPDNVVLLGFQFETINFYYGYILVKYEKKFGIKQRLIVFIINNAAWFNPPPLPPPGHTPQDLQFFSYMAVCSLPPGFSSDHLKKYPLGQRRLDLSQGLAEGVENGSRSTLTMHHAFSYTSKAIKDEMNIVSPW